MTWRLNTMRILTYALAITLAALPALAQGKKPLPPAQPQFKQEVSATKQSFAFAPVKASSTRFSDQVEADAAFSTDEIFATRGVTIFVPDARTQDAAWEKAASSTTTALERIGLVATDRTEFKGFPSDLAMELKSLNLSKRFVLVFRPKDQKVFATMAKNVELLGDRELGMLAYDLRGCAFVIDGQFYFTEKGCQVAMTIGSRVYGNLLGGKPDTGSGNLVPAEWMDTRKLATVIRDSMAR